MIQGSGGWDRVSVVYSPWAGPKGLILVRFHIKMIIIFLKKSPLDSPEPVSG